MGIHRNLPKTEEEVWTAILTAQAKKNDTISGSNILTPSTDARVDAMVTRFGGARTDNIVKQSISHQSTPVKDVLMANQIMFNSHYIQVLNFHIEGKIFPPSYRDFYLIPVNSGAVPFQRSAAEVNTLSRNIIAGEPMMIIAGGTAIPFPVLKTIKDNFDLLAKAEKAHTDAVDNANHSQELLTAILPEAIVVVKKIWDEVETHYNEGTQESKRKNARQWGVVYISSAGPVTITCHVVEMINNQPAAVEGMDVSLVETGEATVTDLEGAGVIKTHITDEATLRFEMEGYESKEVKCELLEGKITDVGVITVVRKP